MCGITGWVSYDEDARLAQPVLEAMVATMARRGPDASGTWLGRHAAIGHRRLAVIDIVGGKQPMTAEQDGSQVVLTYSGEVYNFVELRAELRQNGREFRTQSDTEVVLQAYLAWGEDFVNRLNGMYAFAIWDERAHRLLLVRDRLGVKPLYYARTHDGVVFGSEPKALFAHPRVEPRLDAQGLREAYSLVFNTGPSIWAGVREVLPGAVVVVDRSGLSERRYWQIEARPHTDDLDTTVERIGELLGDTVRRQLYADVPRCALLSGGLDSSILTAMIAERLREQGERVRSFAVDYGDQDPQCTPQVGRSVPDAPFAKEAAAYIGTDHQTILLDSSSLLDPENRLAVVVARDSPTGGGDMDISLYLLFERIRSTSTVAVSGEAADEAFGGYQWFHQPLLIGAPTFPWLLGGTMPLHPQLEATLRIREFQKDAYRSALAAVPTLDGEDAGERRMRELTHISLTRSLQQLLHRKDRLSMAVGLEVRVPYCDHRLVDYAFNVPWAMKSFDGREKSLLRAISSERVPSSVLWRQKSPYPSTRDVAYNRGVADQASDARNVPHSPVRDFVDVDAITPLLKLEADQLQWAQRLRLEWVIDLSLFLAYYNPTIDL